MGQLDLTAAAEEFLAENHLCTFTTLYPDGAPHVAPVRFTWDGEAGLARVMTMGSRTKVRNLLATEKARVAVCQAAGPRWITLEGSAQVLTDPARVQEGIRRYANRYWSMPPDLPGMVVIEIAVDRVMGIY
ncbi:TIGR03618 family F420-dependent PPOX class oxidoreductase [Streptomyces sp. H27-C3]|uniref:pyridoxamine 5'-phosphate oxidase family protein n=1 Tax=Streptomyces sp. H27-C3 TaxID=3046305 RepID=UPI0024BB83D6|nr:TIGR03618 family F420-dependent PPOX class oxidoreductase [Streptomyces sp. H27-C3]MDJ0466269.1 TIGR03618 family F420-dependent PPOX class oxidoreductase [Streptomyces sp. H27-C3]